MANPQHNTNSQMNRSGSSSSLTSEASTKAGTASSRSYGIGGALLHKRFLQMTRQHIRDGEEGRDREMGVETEQAGPGMMSHSGPHGDPEAGTPTPQAETSTGPEPLTPPRPRLPESPLRKRLRELSPFRMLRGRSQSRERLAAVLVAKTPVEGPGQTGPSEAQEGSPGQRQAEQVKGQARRSASPSRAFLWLCRDRHKRRKTI